MRIRPKVTLAVAAAVLGLALAALALTTVRSDGDDATVAREADSQTASYETALAGWFPANAWEPPGACTKTYAGGELQEFLDTFTSTDVGCLPGGEYLPAEGLTHDAGDSILTSVPGERAVIVGRGVRLAEGTDLINVTIREATGLDLDCLSVQGDGNRVIANQLLACGRSNILLGTSSRNALIEGNVGVLAGRNGSNVLPDHGIYVQGIGHDVVRNVFAYMPGYGIHVYSSPSGNDGVQPSDVDVEGNATLYSQTKSGILIQSGAGGDVRTNGNLSALNAEYGINYYSGKPNCPAGPCTIDSNRVGGNGEGAYNSGAEARATNTIAVDAPFVFAPFRVPGLRPAMAAARLPVVVADLREVLLLLDALPEES